MTSWLTGLQRGMDTALGDRALGDRSHHGDERRIAGTWPSSVLLVPVTRPLRRYVGIPALTTFPIVFRQWVLGRTECLRAVVTGDTGL